MTRVFMSYVRENIDIVHKLVNELKSAGVDVWFDQTHLLPGDLWKDVIRREIAQGDFFIACFSSEYGKRRKTFMNEEITQAIDQFRQLSVNQRWFIPVLLSECEIPDRSIGAGETLRSVQWVAIYESWDEGIRQILAAIQPAAPDGRTEGTQVKSAQTPLGDVATLNVKRPLKSLWSLFVPVGYRDITLLTPYQLYVNGTSVGKLKAGSQLILSVKAGTVTIQVLADLGGSDEVNMEALKSAFGSKSDILALALKPGDVIDLECGGRSLILPPQLYLKRKT